MKTNKKGNRRMIFSAGSSSAKKIFVLAILITAALTNGVPGQTMPGNLSADSNAEINNEQPQRAAGSYSAYQQANTPLVDYHTHIWSLAASTLVTEPLLPVIELPTGLTRLLRDKEQFGGKDKNPVALADLYTKDAVVMEPSASGPIWLRGARAIRYVTDSTVIARLLPTIYEVNGSAGFIAGYEANVEGGATQYLNNFHYVIRKESDGKWRIFSEIFTLNPPPVPKAATAEQLIKHLDAEGIKRAAVLSTAFWYGSVFRKSPDDEYGKVRAENDWAAQQVARFPNRLIGFCSFNPLKDYALDELNRCAKNPNLKGLKLHFGNSGVDVTNPLHLEKVSQIFRAANDKGISIVVHLWIVGKYGREHSEAFLNKILPAAPDIPIQIAHMAASGPSYHSDDALEVFANACAAGDRRMKNVYFDVASMVTRDTPQATLELVARRIRQLGIRRVLYGSDRAGTSEDRSRGTWDWAAFQRLQLTAEEFRAIAGNIAPYMR